jgi:hypothetical protein
MFLKQAFTALLWIAAGALIGAPIASVGADSPSVYKWVDDKGVVHYGDNVPPEYAQHEQSVLNQQGVEVGHVEGSKSGAQLADQLRSEDEAHQRAQHDQFLLATYASTKDIEQLRDERLDQIDGQIKAAASYVESLDGRLASLTERAQHFKPYSSDPNARRLPDDLAEDLVRTSNEKHSQSAALDNKRKELDTIRSQFEADIARYHELTSRQRR